MKKLLALLMVVCFSATMIFAQSKSTTKVEKKAGTEAKAPTKKDGTPDKRFKENKEEKAAPAATGQLKKDGTPDMRYKENKEAAKTPAAPAGPVKKDGTPDKRFKENKTAPAKK